MRTSVQGTILEHQQFIFSLQHMARTAQRKQVSVRELLNTPLMRLGGGLRLLHESESRNILSAMEPKTYRRSTRRIRFDKKSHLQKKKGPGLCTKKKRRSSPRHPAPKRPRRAMEPPN